MASFVGRHRTTPHIYGRRIFPKIDRLHRHQDAHLGSDLDHEAFQKLLIRTARSGPPWP